MFHYEAALKSTFNPELGVLVVPDITRQLFKNARHVNYDDLVAAYIQGNFGDQVGLHEQVYNLLAAPRRLPTTGRYSLGLPESITIHTAPDEGTTYIWPTHEALMERPLSGPFLFEPGLVVGTPHAMVVLEDFHHDPLEFYSPHMRGDWGEVSSEMWDKNDVALREGLQLLSSYRVESERLWIISEGDRSTTTFLLPSDF